MNEKPPRFSWLRALGREEMPSRIRLNGHDYAHRRTYKHDFFAATGLYEGPTGRVILKIGRQAPLFGVPLSWMGKYLANHEWRIYEAVQDLPGVPQCLGRWGETGFAHAFVEGHPLQRNEWVDDAFFPRLAAIIEALHNRGIAYVDLEKRENILVDADGQPSLIDFQISWRWDPGPGGRRDGLLRLIPRELGDFILRRLQDGDRYHLLKHRRRHRPDTLTADEFTASYRHGWSIRLHRRLSRPLTLLRRTLLKLLTGRSRSAKQDGPEFIEP